MTNKMYNEEIKDSFLSQVEENSRQTISYVFYKSYDVERFYEKDLFSFNEEQLGEVMKALNPGSVNKARSDMMNLKNYITWAIRKGFRESNIHPLITADSEWYKKFIDKTTKRHYTEEEIDDICNKLKNNQDTAMVRVIFEGGLGKSLSELSSITYNRIDWNNNLITVKDEKDGLERTLKVSDKCMRYIENAYKEETYQYYCEDEKELPLSHDGNHVFRTVNSKRTKTVAATQATFISRLQFIKDYLDLDVFTANSISQSGRIYKAVQLYERDGELGTKQFREIAETYKVPMVKDPNGGEDYANVSLMKDYINSYNLKTLYDIDIEI